MNNARKKEILMDIIPTDVENSKEILNGILETDEKKCLTEFYKKIIEGSTYARGFKTVGDSIIKHLKDKKWGRDVYELAANKAKNSYDCIEVAYSCVRCLDDNKSAKELCKKAVEVAKTSNDYINIADFEFTYFEDASNLSDYYTEAEKLSKDDPYEYYKVGMSVLANTSDVERGAKVIRKAVDSIWESCVLCTIYDELESVSIPENDSDFLKYELLDDIREKMMKEACGVDDYIEIVNNAPSLEEEALEEAEFAATDVDGYLQLAEFYSNDNNESKAKEFYDKALDEAEPDNPEEIAKIKEAMQ